MSHRIAPTAGLRGLTTSAFTGALAVAAHAVAGGGRPTGGAAVLLFATVAVTGLAALPDRASQLRVLLAVLAGGQLAGHLALAAAGHSHHETTSAPSWLMPVMHVVAVVVGATLVWASERLFGALSRVARRCVAVVRLPVAVGGAARFVMKDQPLQHVLLLAASISHRGPPVCARS